MAYFKCYLDPLSFHDQLKKPCQSCAPSDKTFWIRICKNESLLLKSDHLYCLRSSYYKPILKCVFLTRNRKKHPFLLCNVTCILPGWDGGPPFRSVGWNVPIRLVLFLKSVDLGYVLSLNFLGGIKNTL